MPLFKIVNTFSGGDLGVFEADDAQGALDAMAREAGYTDYQASCEVAPVPDGVIIVIPVNAYMVDISLYGPDARYASDDDIYHARLAAEAVLLAANVTSAAAEQAYREQWEEYDDEDKMHGAALIWIAARKAADVAIEETWAVQDAYVWCDLTSTV